MKLTLNKEEAVTQLKKVFPEMEIEITTSTPPILETLKGTEDVKSLRNLVGQSHTEGNCLDAVRKSYPNSFQGSR